VSEFDCYYAGTIMLGQIGVLGNLEAALRMEHSAPLEMSDVGFSG
jgi:hypothetical protein